MADPCPKCHYMRRPQDAAPDWQCPNCGIAIAKYLAHQRGAQEDKSHHTYDPSTPTLLQTQRAWALWEIIVVAICSVYVVAHAIDRPAVRLDDPDTHAAIYADSNHPVVMYATTWCPYCAKARRLFESRHVDYLERDVEHDAEAMRVYQGVLHGKGIPVIVIGDEVIDGYSEEAITEALSRLN